MENLNAGIATDFLEKDYPTIKLASVSLGQDNWVHSAMNSSALKSADRKREFKSTGIGLQQSETLTHTRLNSNAHCVCNHSSTYCPTAHRQATEESGPRLGGGEGGLHFLTTLLQKKKEKRKQPKILISRMSRLIKSLFSSLLGCKCQEREGFYLCVLFTTHAR